MAQITLKQFSLDEAMNGASIGWAVGGNMSNGLDRVAYNFRKGGAGYKYTVNTLTYECNSAGVPFDGDMSKRLYMVDAKLEETRGTVASRGEGENKEEVSIDALQPREQFAMEAMRAIIASFDDPLHVDTNIVIRVADKSFEFAQAMMQKAAEIRAEKKTPSQEKEEINVSLDDVNSVSDKILYNIQVALTNINNLLKENNLKIEVKNESIPVTVHGEAVPVSVQNTVDTIVTNTVDVNVKESGGTAT